MIDLKTRDEEDGRDDINLTSKQISANLPAIPEGASLVKEPHKGVTGPQGNVDTVMGQVKRSIEDVNLSIATLKEDVLNEIYAIRSQSAYPALTVISRSSDMDRANLEIKLDTFTEYLSKFRLGSGTLSDLDIWEFAWDFMEMYRHFGEAAIEMIQNGLNI